MGLVIILAGNLVHLIEKGKRLIALLRQCQIDQHTAVLLSLKLVQRNLHLGMRLLERVHQIIIECHIPFVHFIIEEHKNINKGHTVVRESVHNLGIVLIIHRICHI